MKPYIIFIIAVLIIILSVGVLAGLGVFKASPVTTTPTPSVGPLTSIVPFVIPTGNEDIKTESPQPEEVVSGTVKVTGQVKGSWFFENSFSVKLADDAGIFVAATTAKPLGNAQTEALVPYEATLEVPSGTVGRGSIILQKSNPSGLPENNQSWTIPVLFSAEAATAIPSPTEVSLKAYFGNTRLNPNAATNCEKVFPVDRPSPKSIAITQVALDHLLSGPTDAEKAQGYVTLINPAAKIRTMSFQNGIIEIDFSSDLVEASAGACKKAAVRAQFEQTLMQFPAVQNVILSVNGNKDAGL